MPLADYYHRDAIALSQVLQGYDAQAVTERVESVRLGISFSKATAESFEGAAILNLLVRLAARLYPTLNLRPSMGGDGVASRLAELARAINPAIAIESDTSPNFDILVGNPESQGRARAADLFVGSDGWNALISSRSHQPVGSSANAFGAGAAACLAMANVFRHVFLEKPDLDNNLVFPTVPTALSRVRSLKPPAPPDLVLVGAGAVGNATLWALAASGIDVNLQLVDPETIELSNLQRYVLARRSDVGKSKVDVAKANAGRHLRLAINQVDWAAFAHQHPSQRLVMVAVDSASVRRAIQASLPKTIVNAWTQPGDLGVSVHRFSGQGACLACLYLPVGRSLSEDAIYAQALRIPDQIMRVRALLSDGAAVPRDLLELVAERLDVTKDVALTFQDRGIRTLYSEGICGGAILPLGKTGRPRSEVHVPLAHQSALAGVLLAAETVGMHKVPLRTPITRVNLMRPINPRFLTQYAAKDPRGICICQDRDYIDVYGRKYSDKKA